ncbi:DUF4625 domain-containing protein [Chitinophaga sp. sic0106]|uniref:DUF4625 domain-containing protein n=1 Tax=Chitinophaga sp. sic0106 TaxID=2854785 RepID=UPI001C43870C|nr:DUF4625 domain-containing protein [Chitinophaga sp. sic0106]MBV7531016.1 DUF4625 domain-containing protein [Chitinophaga sp. sic0106]
MKRTRLYYALLLLTAVSLYSCSKDDQQTDTTYPEIDLGISGAFPQQCSIMERGKIFTFRARFTDNMALGSYSLDIHHNFDHHTHSTEVKVCEEEAVKGAVKPMLYIKDFAIPAGTSDYTATAEIDVPADVDPGDYHFLIRLTDKEGWQTLKGISIKII